MARRLSISSILLLPIAFLWILVTVNSSLENWPNHGGDLQNMRYASKETKIGPKTVQNMKLKWIFEAQNDITATPAIYNGILYFPSWDGYIYAVKASSGSLVWKQFIQDLTGIPSTGLIVNVNVTVARATPTVAPDLGLLIVGLYGPCYVLGLRINDGSLAWMTKLDAHIDSLITMSGTYSNRAFYVGVSSLEEERSIEECCHFRGSFVKIDAKTGVILWKTYMLPNNNGQRGEYAGAAIWGSSPPIDVPRKLVYIATGNLYSAPQRIRDCSERENNQTFPTNTTSCVEPENHSNSFLALDLDTGNIKWYHQIGGYDVWFFACHNISSSPDCPPGPNPDADFGEAPMLLTVKINSTRKDIAVATQKSGFTWALDRDTGDLVWSTEAGPGGLGGGGIWGSATDGKRVYTNIANTDQQNFILSPSNKSTTAGGWVAMEASTGKVLWSLGNPSNASTQGPVTVANGVVFAGSTNNVTGPIYAIDAKVGNILWSYDTGATIYGGVSVSDGCIYVGHGYKVGLGSFNPAFSTGKSLFCFCVD
ncbi:uncharacterized protein LOC110683816 [Chenopodium quinoa]|uniref:uncharacterized protein LOC110683816 n=1 Tax=Chenopodium quinoa TaxID=63459 RepID=UPI000B793CFD|nr:uncharacterized protein LOC110683816 [Chenopodium quinoa]